MGKLQKLEQKVIEMVHAVDDNLRTAKQEKSDAKTMEKYETNLIQVRAKLKYVADEPESLLVKNDKRFRGEIKAAYEYGMCKKKTFI
jgi:predicted AAA+ superfamily ATPase